MQLILMLITIRACGPASHESFVAAAGAPLTGEQQWSTRSIYEQAVDDGRIAVLPGRR